MHFSQFFAVYNNNVKPPEIISMENATGVFRFNQWKFYSEIQVDEALIDLDIKYCEQISRVRINLIILNYFFNKK